MEKSLGKTIGKDAKSKKMTYPAVYGMDKSKSEANRLIEEANEIISHYGDKAYYLKQLNNYVITREM